MLNPTYNSQEAIQARQAFYTQSLNTLATYRFLLSHHQLLNSIEKAPYWLARLKEIALSPDADVLECKLSSSNWCDIKPHVEGETRYLDMFNKHDRLLMLGAICGYIEMVIERSGLTKAQVRAALCQPKAKLTASQWFECAYDLKLHLALPSQPSEFYDPRICGQSIIVLGEVLRYAAYKVFYKIADIAHPLVADLLSLPARSVDFFLRGYLGDAVHSSQTLIHDKKKVKLSAWRSDYLSTYESTGETVDSPDFHHSPDFFHEYHGVNGNRQHSASPPAVQLSSTAIRVDNHPFNLSF